MFHSKRILRSKWATKPIEIPILLSFGKLGCYPRKNDIEVQGHASSEGTNDYNMGLSQRRSESVVEYLKKMKGVTNRLIAQGRRNPVYCR
ncbi:MAG: OmpA family protein [Methylococcales bacterium]